MNTRGKRMVSNAIQFAQYVTILENIVSAMTETMIDNDLLELDLPRRLQRRTILSYYKNIAINKIRESKIFNEAIETPWESISLKSVEATYSNVENYDSISKEDVEKYYDTDENKAKHNVYDFLDYDGEGENDIE